MKKVSLLLVMATTLLFSNSFAQVTQKGGTSTGTSQTSTDKADKGDKKDKVQSEMSGEAASMAQEWTKKMDEICTLTPDQEKKVMEINLRYANKLEELKAKYKGQENPSADAAKAEKDELTKQRFKEYSNVLSKEQMQKFKEYRNSKKGEGDEMGDKSDKKEKAKEEYKNATPEEKEKMKEEMKDKKDKKEKSKE